MSDAALAALLARRLCHDFAGPAGAIGTVVDMLGEGSDPELVSLATDSVRALVAAVELYRFVLTPNADPVGGGRARELLVPWLESRGGPALDWSSGDEDWPAGIAALTAGLAMVSADAGTRGTLVVTRGQIVAEGVTLPSDAEAALRGGAAKTTRSALAATIAGIAAQEGRKIEVSADETLRLSVA